MAFIFEQIGRKKGEELQKKYEFINPVTNHPVNPYFWAIDEDEGAFIVGLGTTRPGDDPDNSEWYAIIWNEKRIDIETASDYQKKVVIAKSITAPQELLSDATKTKLGSLVKDAVFAYRNAPAEHMGYEQAAEIKAR